MEPLIPSSTAAHAISFPESSDNTLDHDNLSYQNEGKSSPLLNMNVAEHEITSSSFVAASAPSAMQLQHNVTANPVELLTTLKPAINADGTAAYDKLNGWY